MTENIASLQGNGNSDSRVRRPSYDSNTQLYSYPKPCLVMRNQNIFDKINKNETHINEKRQTSWMTLTCLISILIKS